MKGKSFEIKIADLLNHLGSDTLDFEGMQTSLLPHLTAEGMSGSLYIHSVDGKSVLVTLTDFSATVQEICDICGKTFLRPVQVEEYVVKFALDPQEFAESKEEVLLPIDMKSDAINVEEMLYQAVQLETPFVMKCADCEIV